MDILKSSNLPESLVLSSNNSYNSFLNIIKSLINNKILFEKPLSDNIIEQVLLYFSGLDSNNFKNKIGFGEREGRVLSNLVLKRHYYMSHGIGRSGELFSVQPKAAGSSLICDITNKMTKNLLKKINLNCKNLIIFPNATGVSLMFSLLALKKEINDNNKDTIIYLRIDQKSGIKSIEAAGLKIVNIDGVLSESGCINTNIPAVEDYLKNNCERVLCILSTTSCFAPRESDDITAIGKLARKYNCYHLLNNAYGIQCKYLRKVVNNCLANNLVDLVVSSTDKNFMVPIGGSIIYSNNNLTNIISKLYSGRATNNIILDLFITYLSSGLNNIINIFNEREDNYLYMKNKAVLFSKEFELEVIENKYNMISIAISFANNLKISSKANELISSIYRKNIMGVRIVKESENKEICGIKYSNYGSHIEKYPKLPYMNIACAVGLSKSEIDKGFKRLHKIFKKHNL